MTEPTPRPAICMISTHFHPRAGGAEKQTERLSAWLVQHGVPVMVVTRRYDKTLPRHEVLAGVDIYRIPVLPGKLGGALSFLALSVVFLLRHRRRFNIVHSHQVFTPSTIGWLATRLLRYPLVVHLHSGGYTGDLAKLLRHKWSGGLRLAALKRAAVAFIAVSKEIEQELLAQGIPPAQVHLLYNSADPTVFHPVDAETKFALRRKLNLPAEGPLVVYVGRLVENKGVQALLDAWRQTPPSAHLVIVGAGPMAEALQQQAAGLDGRVTFVGQQHNVPKYLQASAAWVLPSFSEGLPLSLLEAMACALPVIATSVGAIPEVVESGVNGLLAPPRDVQALAEALNRVLEQPDEAHAMGERARQTVLERYSLDIIGQDYLKFLDAWFAHR